MLLTVLAVLAATAGVAPLLARWMGRNAGWPVAVSFLALAAVVAAQAPLVLDGGTVAAEVAWIPSADILFRLRMDGIGLLFSMLVLGVGGLIMAYCARYFGPTTSQSRFYLLMGIFAVAMLGLVLADDLLLLFVFWELTSICSYFLIGGTNLKADRPALRALIITAGGGLALLAAVALLSVRAGTTQLSVVLSDLGWLEDGWTGTLVALLVILAAFTKSAQVPFHFWLPGAMAASTPVSAYLHAAAMVKAGIYLLMRFTPAFADLAVWNALLIGFGLATAVYGALLALKAHDLKLLAAYSTVSQLGYLVATIGVGTSYALAAAAIHTLAHALFKATLFMMVGVIEHQSGHRDIRDSGGLRWEMPASAVITGLAAMSLAGLPPLLGFYSKEKIFAAFIEAGGPPWVGPVAGAIAVLAAVLTFGYAARFWYGVFGGPLPSRGDVDEAPVSFLLAPAITAAAGLLLGLGVVGLAPYAERIVVDGGFGAASVDIHLIPGLTPDLGMSVVAILLGAGLFLARDQVDEWLGRIVAPVTGDGAFDRVYQSSLALGRRTVAPVRGFAPAVHLAPALLLLGLLAAGAVWLGVPVSPSPGPLSRPTDWIVVLGVTAAVIALVVARARIAAVVLLGVVGALVGVWFLVLGAVDVALTQLVVEVLTVVVLVLVLRRLPYRFHRAGRLRTSLAAVLGVGAGVLTTAGTFLLTGRREVSAVSEWLMANSEEETGGINVVNTILVDFRALDTLGEVTVVGLAGLGIIALLETTQLKPTTPPRSSGDRPEDDPVANSVVVRTVGRALAPVIAVLSLYMLFRGHDAHGGGFIGALVAGAGLCLAHAAAPDPRRSLVRRLPYVPVIAGGLALAVGTGLLGLVAGGFLRPIPFDIGPLHLTTSVVFDIGVYLIVVGTVIAALRRLGMPQEAEGPIDPDTPLPPSPRQAAGGGERPGATVARAGRDPEEGEQ